MLLQILSGTSESQIALHPTGIKIASITSSPELYLTDTKEVFYVKTAHEFELRQLSFLKEKHIPIPHLIAYDPTEHRIIATKDSGISLEAYFERHISLKKRQYLLVQTGQLLRNLHKTLQKGVPVGILRTSYKPTAHIVDCFFYKYPEVENRIPLDLYTTIKTQPHLIRKGRKSLKSLSHSEYFLKIREDGEWNKFHNASIKLQHLIYLLDRVGTRYMHKMTPYIYEVITKDKEGNTKRYDILESFKESPMYGDFKPENILVEQVENPKNILCIDPEIMLGTPSFDLAKFINRYLIDTESDSQRKLVLAFLNAYTIKKINVFDKVYGPFTFLDLMTLDLLNLFKSLLSRYSANEKNYRLTLHLDNPQFCNKITQLLLDIQTIHSNEEFYDYLQFS